MHGKGSLAGIDSRKVQNFSEIQFQIVNYWKVVCLVGKGLAFVFD